MEEAPFLNLEEGMEFLLSQCEKYFKNISLYPAQELADTLNYRDDLQISLEGNFDIPHRFLERILALDETLKKVLPSFKNQLDKNFVETMKNTYPCSHWWWHL